MKQIKNSVAAPFPPDISNLGYRQLHIIEGMKSYDWFIQEIGSSAKEDIFLMDNDCNTHLRIRESTLTSFLKRNILLKEEVIKSSPKSSFFLNKYFLNPALK